MVEDIYSNCDIVFVEVFVVARSRNNNISFGCIDGCAGRVMVVVMVLVLVVVVVVSSSGAL